MNLKKIVIPSPGGYEKLLTQSFPDLQANDHSIVVDVKGIGVNYADCLVRFGVYESAKKYVGWPITPGFEFSGIVKAIGKDVTKFKIGEEVVGITLFNAYATQVNVKENQLFHIPSGFSLIEAAGFATVFFTAYHALFQLVKIYPGSHVLVHSAAGGVGSALVQLAKAFNFKVTGVVGASHKIQDVKNLGADFVIDKSSQDLWNEAKKVCPEGYDAIFDANGYTTLKEGYNHLRAVGKIISYGAHSLMPRGGSGRVNYFKALIGLIKSPRFSPLQLITDNKSVIGFNLSFLFARQDLALEAMTDLMRLAQDKKIKPLKTTTFKFSEVGKAHQALESGTTVGKIVLVVD
ncbi:MAG: zinc-binding dehydrogenase [Bdellovibrionota bacterium]